MPLARWNTLAPQCDVRHLFSELSQAPRQRGALPKDADHRVDHGARFPVGRFDRFHGLVSGLDELSLQSFLLKELIIELVAL